MFIFRRSKREVAAARERYNIPARDKGDFMDKFIDKLEEKEKETTVNPDEAVMEAEEPPVEDDGDSIEEEKVTSGEVVRLKPRKKVILSTKEVSQMLGTTPQKLRLFLRNKLDKYDDAQYTRYQWEQDSQELKAVMEAYRKYERRMAKLKGEPVAKKQA